MVDSVLPLGTAVDGVLGRLWLLLPPTAGLRPRLSDFCELDEYSSEEDKSSGATCGMFLLLDWRGGSCEGGGMARLSLEEDEEAAVKDL